jgi:MEMO1 family protein
MQISAEECPKLRPVDAFPITVRQEHMICLRDPEQLAGENVYLSQPAFFIASLLNGRESLRDIQTAFFRQFGEIIYLEKIQELVQALDERRFLDSDSFREFRSRTMEDFRLKEYRPATHAGNAYDRDPERLRQQMDGFFEHPDGVGSAQQLAGVGKIRGLIAPHIDFQRGGPVYSWAYGALRDSPAHDVYVIFGTSHTPLPQPFCLTMKKFQTPLGDVPTDRDMARQLIKKSHFDLLEGEWAQRSEHSIEFQTVFLKYLFPDRPFAILPVLCGNILHDRANQSEPVVPSQVSEFLSMLKAITSGTGKRVCFIAGADLAHMGPRFGDPAVVNPDMLSWLQAMDLNTLGKVERMEGTAFLEEIAEERDRRRICGLAPIYSMLEVCGAGSGKLLRYGQAADPEGTQVVSFASMVFH